MRRSYHRAGILCILMATPLLSAFSLDFELIDPPAGNGSQWDCSYVGGISDTFSSGSPVWGGIYKKVSGVWQQPYPLPPYSNKGTGPIKITALYVIDVFGFFETEPDDTLGVADVFTNASKGEYKIKVHMMDNATMQEVYKENHWNMQ